MSMKRLSRDEAFLIGGEHRQAAKRATADIEGHSYGRLIRPVGTIKCEETDGRPSLEIWVVSQFEIRHS